MHFSGLRPLQALCPSLLLRYRAAVVVWVLQVRILVRKSHFFNRPTEHDWSSVLTIESTSRLLTTLRFFAV